MDVQTVKPEEFYERVATSMFREAARRLMERDPEHQVDAGKLGKILKGNVVDVVNASVLTWSLERVVYSEPALSSSVTLGARRAAEAYAGT